jgi:hypothetical protein
MRTTGGTIYTFSSAVEDIGLNINERNNVVKISHFALLNIPKINEPDSIAENRFNVLAIPSAFEYQKTGNSIKDGRVIIAESFQNYALNFEANLLNQTSYDSTLSRTVSERVFWKWLKETGAIRWANPSNGYWMEVEDSDGSVGYNTVVKYFGQVSAGNIRQDSFGTYNETYILVPTSHGQMEPFFEQIEDTNYMHGMQIGGLGENILGREGWTRPHPDGLSFSGYYDYIDSSAKVWDAGSYSMTVNGTPGGWYSAEGINPSAQNTYLIDTSSYLLTGDYDASIRYQNGGEIVEFKRSKADCMGLILDINKLQTIYPAKPNLTFDQLAMDSDLVVNDTFEFNAVMIYYSVYNSVEDTILATNLLGILFLDAPSGNTQLIGDGLPGIIIPSLEKIQSGVSGFGTSYNLRVNIKSDNMVDDTAAIIVDNATSDQLQADNWNQAFYELEKAVNILTQNNGVLNYVSDQYIQIQNIQTQMLNELNQLELTVNDIGGDIKGTSGTIALFDAGDDPLIDSSIYQSAGNIGFFNQTPSWPVQIDASLKTKNIYIEKSLKDVSGNNILSYGSPISLGSSTNFREINFYTGNASPAIFIDTSNGVSIPSLENSLKESSLGTSFIWTGGIVDVSAGGGGGGITYSQMKSYVDPSLNLRDIAINLRLKESSLGSGFQWAGQYLTVNASSGGGITYSQMKSYVDPSLSARDASIAWLSVNKQPLGNYATPLYVTSALLPYATNASIGTAGFAKIANTVAKAGDSMSGDLTLQGGLISNGSSITLNGGHAIFASSVDAHITADNVEQTMWSPGSVIPKGNKLFISFSAPFHSTVTGRRFYVYLYMSDNGGAYVKKRTSFSGIYQESMNVSFQHIETPVIPGHVYSFQIRWKGGTSIYQNASVTHDSGYGGSERILTIIDLY